MNYIVYSVLAAGVILSAGCSKEESAPVDVSPQREQVQTPAADMTQKAETVMAQATEKAETVMAQATEKAETVMAQANEKAEAVMAQATEKAESVAAQATEKMAAVTAQAQAVAQKVEALKSAIAIKPDEVLAELNQPVAEIQTKVASLEQPELLAYVSTYKDVLLEKKEQLAGLTSQLKSLSMSEMLGTKGNEIKTQLSQYTSQLSGLKERYSVYLDKLKALGVDLSAFGL
jgi:hypothetical protein